MVGVRAGGIGSHTRNDRMDGLAPLAEEPFGEYLLAESEQREQVYWSICICVLGAINTPDAAAIMFSKASGTPCSIAIHSIHAIYMHVRQRPLHDPSLPYAATISACVLQGGRRPEKLVFSLLTVTSSREDGRLSKYLV
jgi:hypothetical protein